MLTAPLRPASDDVGPQPVAVRPRTVRVEVRQRRTLAVIGVVFCALVVMAATTGAAAGWWATLAVAVAAVGYVALVARVRHLSAEREMSAAFVHDAPIDWDAFGRELAAAGAANARAIDEESIPTVRVGNRDLGRFVFSYALGLALTPIVASIRLARGDLSDLERHSVIDRLVTLQQQGRAQSLRVIAVGVVATAGVTTVGAMAAPGLATAAPAVSTSAPVSAAGSSTYRVVAGDTLASIAARFGVSISGLASVNHIANPNVIEVGQSLVISGSSGSSGSSSSSSYTVVSGDTLASIAARYGVSVSSIASANHIADPNLIYVGETISVSGSSVSTAGASGGGSSVPAANGSYTVRGGDTLAVIASRYSTTVDNLAALNHLSNPNVLYVGEVLKVDGTAPSSSVTTASATTSSSTSSGSSSASSSSGSAGSSAPSTAGESSAAAEAVKVALAQVGKPYSWGGAGPSSFDCSGLVMYAYAAAGVSLPHFTVSQMDDTTRVSSSQLEPGDLVFYNTGGGAQPGHVAMYIGGGRVVSANTTGTNVQTQSLSWDGQIMAYGRVR